jgi:membrane peptidoglycan carboxypeptidase
MVAEGYITQEQADAAKNEVIEFQSIEDQNIKAPHFVFYVQQLLAQEFGEEIISAGGLRVITTLDWEKQQIADDVVHGTNEGNLARGATNAALVSLDAKTGEILAMVGSQDYFNDDIDGQVNVAIQPRQPGSSIKPIVYAAAIEKGYTAETVVYDVNTNFAVSGQAYEPKNYDLQERGPVTLRSALQGSLNIPAVKALYLAGVDTVMKKMEEELGYSTINETLDCGLSLVLGGCEVTLLDHASAYTAFARDGERAIPAAILEVYSSDGEKLFEFKENKQKVWDVQVARVMNNIMSDDASRAPYFGTGSLLTIPGKTVAAKTGTTNDYNDAWMLGYTPSFVTGVWVGNADGTDMNRGAGGSTVAAPIWNQYMRQILADLPNESFKAPDPLPEDLKGVLNGNLGGQVEIEVDTFSGKLATEFTPESAREKRTYREDHSILHYVYKNNPRG